MTTGWRAPAAGLRHAAPLGDRSCSSRRGGPPAGYPALAGSRSYSEHTQWLVDQEVAALLTKAETRARDLLTRHREALAQLTAALLEQETVTGDQVRAIAQAASPAPSTDGPPSFLRLASRVQLPAMATRMNPSSTKHVSR